MPPCDDDVSGADAAAAGAHDVTRSHAETSCQPGRSHGGGGGGGGGGGVVCNDAYGHYNGAHSQVVELLQSMLANAASKR